MIHSGLWWNSNIAKPLSSEKKVRIWKKGDGWFVPAVTFICRDLQLCVKSCGAGWGITKGAVEHTGIRVFLYLSCRSIQKTITPYQPAQTHTWTSWRTSRGCILQLYTTFFYLLVQTQWAHSSVGSFFSWQILTLMVRLRTQPPDFPLNFSPSFLTKTWKSFRKSRWCFSHLEVDIWEELDGGCGWRGLHLDFLHLPWRVLHQSDAEALSSATSCGLMLDWCIQTLFEILWSMWGGLAYWQSSLLHCALGRQPYIVVTKHVKLEFESLFLGS